MIFSAVNIKYCQLTNVYTNKSAPSHARGCIHNRELKPNCISIRLELVSKRKLKTKIQNPETRENEYNFNLNF